VFDAPPPTLSDRESATRERLLDAAGEVFSQRGFRDATIREICSRAGTNVAAVNYHFRDKEALYRDVLRHADRCAAGIKPLEQELANQASGGTALDACSKLRLFIRGYVAAMVDDGKTAWHNKLIAREMMEPTPALDAIIDQNIRPRSEMIAGVLRELLGPAATDERVIRCKLSIIGQCLMYHIGRHVIERLHPQCSVGADTIDCVAAHVAEFSLAAIDGLRRTAEQERR